MPMRPFLCQALLPQGSSLLAVLTMIGAIIGNTVRIGYNFFTPMWEMPSLNTFIMAPVGFAKSPTRDAMLHIVKEAQLLVQVSLPPTCTIADDCLCVLPLLLLLYSICL